MRCGVNYMPSKSRLHFWSDFDEESVHREKETDFDGRKYGEKYMKAIENGDLPIIKVKS